MLGGSKKLEAHKRTHLDTWLLHRIFTYRFILSHAECQRRKTVEVAESNQLIYDVTVTTGASVVIGRQKKAEEDNISDNKALRFYNEKPTNERVEPEREALTHGDGGTRKNC